MLALRFTQKLVKDMNVAPVEAGEVSIGKTNAKSVLGTMNEMSFYCKGAEFDHMFDLCTWLNSLMYKPINYEEPIKVFKETLETKYS